MKKYFVFSDVHGCYDVLMNSLFEAGFDYDNEEHCIISLGDNFDRGKQNFKVFNFLYNFPVNRKILIRGNHELLLELMVDRYDALYHDIVNGTKDTYVEFRKELNDNQIKKVIDFTKGMRNYCEISGHIFVHGFIPDDYRFASEEEWELAYWMNSSKKINNLPDMDKTIVVGHVASFNFHDKFDIFISDFDGCNLIALDSNTPKTDRVNILVMNEDGSYENKRDGVVLKNVVK